MSRDNANSKRAEVGRGENQRDVVPSTACEEASTRDTQIGRGPVLQWRLDEYHSECAGWMSAKRFKTMTVGAKS